MLVIRLVLVLGVVLMGGSFGAFFFTKDRRYLRLAWQLLRLMTVVLAVIVVLLFIERLI
jgi:hypothetical protein